MSTRPNPSRQWRSRALVARQVPPGLDAWLFEHDSLTRRLKGVCGHGARIQLLEQAWKRPLADERSVLGLRAGRHALVRQVALMCDERPLIFARSIFPMITLRGAGLRFANLGNRPLADILFKGRAVHRDPIRYTHVTPDHPLYPMAVPVLGEGQTSLWARRSRFTVGGRPLLVTEVFAPEIARVR